MEKYEPLGVVGEGSYGIVLKCKNRADNKIVAIKKFIDSEDDANVRKIALREIRVLKKLRHENLVNLLEVFRRRKHLYLVFEFIDHTLLEQLEQKNHGLEEEDCRKYIFQILRGLGFCHDNNVIHRDVKPENVLVSANGIVKLCDFGFARNLCGPGENYTDYVATRWYRAPELLVGDVAYGKSVDIWAAGCLFAEMSTGEPLFPGDSDIDQLFLIAQCLGRLSKRHLNIMSKNSAFRGFQFPKSRHGSTTSTNSTRYGGGMGGSHPSFSSHMHATASGKRRQSPYGMDSVAHELPSTSVFASMFPSWTEDAVHFLTVSLDPEPTARPTCNSLMRMAYFTQHNFPAKFLVELSTKLELEGRPPLTTATIRKKRSLGNPGTGGANVNPGNISGIGQRNSFGVQAAGSNEQFSQPFQSNNLINQNQFGASTNLSRQPGAQKEKNNTEHSRIPIALTRKSSEEALNLKNASALEDSKEKRFSVSQTPKTYSFSISRGDESRPEQILHSLPVTTLTFSLGSHNTSYNGSTFSTSTIPAPVRSKSPSFPSTQNPNALPLANLKFRRASPVRVRKKVSLGGDGQIQSGFNPRPIPVGVTVLGSSFGTPKVNANAWSSSSTTGEHFLPRMTPKNGISLNPSQQNGIMDENNPNPFSNYGNTNNFGKKREKLDQLQPLSQSRRSSFSTDLGNIKPFLIPAPQDRDTTSPQKSTSSYPVI